MQRSLFLQPWYAAGDPVKKKGLWLCSLQVWDGSARGGQGAGRSCGSLGWGAVGLVQYTEARHNAHVFYL